jgi:hypothetical protein
LNSDSEIKFVKNNYEDFENNYIIMKEDQKNSLEPNKKKTGLRRTVKDLKSTGIQNIEKSFDTNNSDICFMSIQNTKQ